MMKPYDCCLLLHLSWDKRCADRASIVCSHVYFDRACMRMCASDARINSNCIFFYSPILRAWACACVRWICHVEIIGRSSNTALIPDTERQLALLLLFLKRSSSDAVPSGVSALGRQASPQLSYTCSVFVLVFCRVDGNVADLVPTVGKTMITNQNNPITCLSIGPTMIGIRCA